MPPKAPKSSRRFQVPETIPKLPPSLPGRETEFDTVVNHVLDHFEGSPDSTPILFVSGACGSGKTATISRAEAYLQSLPSIEKTPKDRKAPDGADVRKAIAMCANAINAQQKKSVTSPKLTGVKRAREENESADGKPAKPQRKATLQALRGAVTDAQSSLDQIQTLSPYTRQVLICFVECVKQHSSNSFGPSRLREELYKKTKELNMNAKSSSDVIGMLDELSNLGFLTTAATKKTQKVYTLSCSLAELEPKLALIPGFM